MSVEDTELSKFSPIIKTVKGVKIYKYPSIPYLTNSPKKPTTDKIISEIDCRRLFLRDLTATEKVDGTNVGISLQQGQLVLQKRSGLITGGDHPQYGAFRAWVYERSDTLQQLQEDVVLYGEWCFAKHNIYYSHLPDYFLLFDVWNKDQFVETSERNYIARQFGLHTVPVLFTGRTILDNIPTLVRKSDFGDSLLEGIVVGDNSSKAKFVRENFTQGREDFQTRLLRNSLVPPLP